MRVTEKIIIANLMDETSIYKYNPERIYEIFI